MTPKAENAAPLSSLHSNEMRAVRQRLIAGIVGALETVVARQRADYPYLNTKFDISSGRNFHDNDPIRGRQAIYSWIQGRGIEALCEHARWLGESACVPRETGETLIAAINHILPPVVEQMEQVRRTNRGLLPFVFRHDAAASASCSLASATSMSDLFYCKGLAAAGFHFNRRDWIDCAAELFQRVTADLGTGKFQLGQIAFDPRNPVEAIPGRYSHAGRMVGIGAATLFYRLTGDAAYLELGLEFIRYVLKNHTLSKEIPLTPFLQGDFWEFIDADRNPWSEPNEEVVSDPGHATEFTGLALAHMEHCPLGNGELRKQLANVLLRNFQNGFTGIGIVKTFDLRARRVINGDMPWWSLPETMRAAALAAQRSHEWGGEADPFVEIFFQCEGAFVRHYLFQGSCHFAVQNLDREGRVSAAIPAIPDADPCYHTGLSLIGCLDWLEHRLAQRCAGSR